MARQLGESEVFIVRDEAQANSAKLLGLLGFEFYETQAETGREIYRCQV